MAHKKYDYIKVCKELGYEYKREDGSYVELISELGFLHRMTKGALLKGAKAKIVSVVGDKKDYFIKELEGRHPDILKQISFKGFEYKGSLVDTVVHCKKHGGYKTKPSYLMQCGNVCRDCDSENKSERNKIENKEFIERCRTKHGDKYSYKKTLYTGCKDKVTVTCPIHGDFEVVAYYHASQNGCQECGKESMGISKELYRKMCPDGSYVYIMSFKNEDEDFIKVGLTKDLRVRVNGLRSVSDYDVNLIYSLFFVDASIAWGVERLLLKEFSDSVYNPNIRFSGDTECFDLSITDEVIKLLQCVANFKQNPCNRLDNLVQLTIKQRRLI